MSAGWSATVSRSCAARRRPLDAIGTEQPYERFVFFAAVAVLRRRGFMSSSMPAVALREPFAKASKASWRIGPRFATTRIP